MGRNYNLAPKKKKDYDKKIVSMCVAVGCIAVFSAYFYCGTLKAETASLNQELQDEQSLKVSMSDMEEELDIPVDVLPSDIGSMSIAGNAIADVQNQLIKANDEYLATVENARAAGYTDPILHTTEYDELLSSARTEYMQDLPSGVQSEIWSLYGQWEFNGDYDFSMQRNTSIPAVWTCYDTEDSAKKHPYAIVTAQYLPASGEFVEARFSKTEWYPSPDVKISDEAWLAGMENDPTVSADQCEDLDAANGSNDDGIMTDEQKKVREELQRLIDGEKAKKDAVIISH